MVKNADGVTCPKKIPGKGFNVRTRAVGCGLIGLPRAGVSVMGNYRTAHLSTKKPAKRFRLAGFFCFL